jgi:SPP1 family predicted phage head-tail adaptor
MKSGQLDQRISVERLQGGVDELGQPLPDTWAPLFTCWAAVEPLTGREYLAAQAAVSEVTAKIRMRFRPWMTAEDRVIHDGTIYNIVSLIDVRSANRELVLMCKALS